MSQTIAFLGLGAMGVRMSARLIEAGFAVRVWNRTAAAAASLEAAGATAAATPREAATGADLVISMVRDDAASEAVWLDADAGALAGLSAEALAIECSTLSVPYIRRLSDDFAARARRLIDAPLLGSRPQAEAGALIFLAGGAEADVAAARPALEVMGAAIHHLGPIGSGAVAKLMGNALFGVQVAAMAELIGFATDAGVDVPRTIEALSATPVVSPAARIAAGAMLAGQFAPLFPIDLVAKDFALLDASRREVDARTPVAAAAGGVFAEAVRDGFGGDNIVGVTQLYSRPTTN